MGSSYGQGRAAASRVKQQSTTMAKKKSTTMKGGIEKYMQENKEQKALKPSQKFGLPRESGAYKSGAQPADYGKGKSDKPAAKKPAAKKPAASKPAASKPAAPSMAEKRSAMKPIAGISNTGGMLTRTLPGGDSLGKSASSVAKGVSTRSRKEQMMADILAKGKKKNGTMKASAQRKIAKLRKG